MIVTGLNDIPLKLSSENNPIQSIWLTIRMARTRGHDYTVWHHCESLFSDKSVLILLICITIDTSVKKSSKFLTLLQIDIHHTSVTITFGKTKCIFPSINVMTQWVIDIKAAQNTREPTMKYIFLFQTNWYVNFYLLFSFNWIDEMS